jgi:hypothetical protein
MSRYKLIDESYFDVATARTVEQYTLLHKTTNWRGKDKWDRIWLYHPEATRRPVRGDLEWAKRVAQEYNIPLPLPKKESK